MIEKELESAERIFYIPFSASFLANDRLNSRMDNVFLELSDGKSRISKALCSNVEYEVGKFPFSNFRQNFLT